MSNVTVVTPLWSTIQNSTLSLTLYHATSLSRLRKSMMNGYRTYKKPIPNAKNLLDRSSVLRNFPMTLQATKLSTTPRTRLLYAVSSKSIPLTRDNNLSPSAFLKNVDATSKEKIWNCEKQLLKMLMNC